MKLQHGDRVVVCDGGRYVIYQNQGDIGQLDLRVVTAEAFENPPTHEQGAGRAGRMPDPTRHKSALEQTDLHDQEEERFVQGLANQLNRTPPDMARDFVLVADPRSMGRLREALSSQAQARIVQSITGDYVHRPVEVIEALIAKA